MIRAIPLCVVILLTADPCRAELPALFREKAFTCASLAEAVNHYVALGEKEGLKELKSASLDWNTNRLDRFSRNERIGWVCRILFEPRGKEPLRGPAYGGLSLPRNTMSLSRWPLYPVAHSGSTYFVLAEGYRLAGFPEDPKDYLDYCQINGKFRTEQIPMPTRPQALKDLEQLRQSEAWKIIKWKDSGQGFSYSMSEQEVWDFMKSQTEKLPAK